MSQLEILRGKVNLVDCLRRLRKCFKLIMRLTFSLLSILSCVLHMYVHGMGGDVFVRAEINYISTTSWTPDDNYGT